jgi:hypothetical protein
MVSLRWFHKSFLKNRVEFEIQCLDIFLAMFDDQFFFNDGNENLENE